MSEERFRLAVSMSVFLPVSIYLAIADFNILTSLLLLFCWLSHFIAMRTLRQIPPEDKKFIRFAEAVSITYHYNVAAALNIIAATLSIIDAAYALLFIFTATGIIFHTGREYISLSFLIKGRLIYRLPDGTIVLARYTRPKISGVLVGGVFYAD